MVLIRTLHCPSMYSSPARTRPGSAARAGTLTYIHTYVSKPMSTTVDRAIASLVRRRLGLATGRPDLIFSKLWSLGEPRPPSPPPPPPPLPPLALHFALASTLTLRIIGNTFGPVALLCAVSTRAPSSRSNQIASGSCEQRRGEMLLAERRSESTCIKSR